jgi:RNA polymerase sigma factor (sigma-70 family)
MESMNGPDLRGRADADLLRLVQSRPAGDPERQAAWEILVGRYENIVRSCVSRYRTGPELSEDLMQVGYVGLMKAVNNFDPEAGDCLAAYALPCVSGEIKRYFRDKRWQVRVRRSTQELRLRIGSVIADLTQQLSRPPGDAELAAHLGVTEAEVTATSSPARPSRPPRSTPRRDLMMTAAAWVTCSAPRIPRWSTPSTWKPCGSTPLSCPRASSTC